jgi:hypothetical protein
MFTRLDVKYRVFGHAPRWASRYFVDSAGFSRCVMGHAKPIAQRDQNLVTYLMGFYKSLTYELPSLNVITFPAFKLNRGPANNEKIERNIVAH